MKYTVYDALKQVDYLSDMVFNMFFYDKQLDLHIWTVYNINNFKGFEIHYNELTELWSYYIWNIESEMIQDIMLQKSTPIGENHEEDYNTGSVCDGSIHCSGDCKCSR